MTSDKNFPSYSDWTGFDLNSFRGASIEQVASCPMCNASLNPELRDADPYRRLLLPADLAEVNIEPLRLLRCPECKWWGIEEVGADTDGKDYYFGFHFLVSAVCRWYDIGAKDVPVSVLREYLATKGDLDFRLIHPWAFERLIADCLQHEFGPCEVYHVGVHGGGGDGGIDIFMIKDDVTWLVQVKRRINSKPESVETVRLLNGALLREGRFSGMVVTSAESFTKNALSEAVIKTPGPYAVQLINRGGVMEMFSKVPSADLDRFLEEKYPTVTMCPLSWEMVSLLKGEASEAWALNTP